MTYPCLLPRYNLRMSKGKTFVYDLRDDIWQRLDPVSAGIMNMMDGSLSVGDLSEYAHAWGNGTELVETVLREHREKWITRVRPLPAIPHLESFGRQTVYRLKAWPFSKWREESPFRMSLGLTQGCNYQCRHCYQGKTHKADKNLPVAVWINFLTQCAEMGVQVVTISGGEPLLYPGFFEILDACQRLGLYPKILTNGSLLNREAIDRMAEKGVEYVHLNLPAVDRRLYNEITATKGHLPKVLTALAMLKRKGIYVKVKMVLTPRNVSHVEKVIQVCAEAGVDEVFLAPYILTDKEGAENIVSRGDIAFVAEKAKEWEKTVTGTVLAYDESDMLCWRSPEDINACGAVKDGLTVRANGDMGFCEPLMALGHFISGNIQTDTLEDVWYSAVPDEGNIPRQVKEPCSSCCYLPACKTGCMLFSLLDSGDCWGVDPRCFNSRSNLFGRCYQ